jgi:mRNA interferase MazF
LKRGDIITVAVTGDYGKPRPAVIVQSDRLAEGDSVLVALVTATIRLASFYRFDVEPTPENGLRQHSQIQVNMVMAVARAKCGPVIGRLTPEQVAALNSLLSLMLGVAE